MTKPVAFLLSTTAIGIIRRLGLENAEVEPRAGSMKTATFGGRALDLVLVQHHWLGALHWALWSDKAHQAATTSTLLLPSVDMACTESFFLARRVLFVATTKYRVTKTLLAVSLC